MHSYWHNKSVVITGASSGIGSALACELAARGSHVSMLARRGELLAEIVAGITSRGGRALALTCDVRDQDAVRWATQEAHNAFNRIDVAIANAGIGVEAPAWEIKPDDVAETFAVNVQGAVNLVAAVLPFMLKEGGGQLVAISSLAAFRGLPRSAAYSASKAALSNYFESLRVDLRGKGIDVTTIHPGYIRTPMTGGDTAQAPFLLELDAATRILVRALEQRPSTYAFPWQLALIANMAKFLPCSLYDRLVSRIVPDA